MEITQGDLIDFLKKGSYSEDIEQVKVKFAEDGIVIDAMTTDNICLVKTKIRADKINNYAVGEEIGIKDVCQLIKYISRLSGSINVLVNNEILIFKQGSKTVEVTLADKSYIKVEDIDRLLEKGKDIPVFIMQTKILKEIMEDAKLWKDHAASIYFFGEPSRLKVELLMGTDKIIHEYPMPDITTKFTTGFRTENFEKLVKSLTAESVKLKMVDMFPIIVEEHTDTIDAYYVLAALYTDEQKEKEKGETA